MINKWEENIAISSLMWSEVYSLCGMETMTHDDQFLSCSSIKNGPDEDEDDDFDDDDDDFDDDDDDFDDEDEDEDGDLDDDDDFEDEEDDD